MTFQPGMVASVAEAYGMLRRGDKSLSLLAQALVLAKESGQRGYEPDLYQLRGELLLTLSANNQVETETSFRKVIDVFREL